MKDGFQSTGHNLGHRKHHQAFGKFAGNKNKTVNLQVERERDAESKKKREMNERKKNPMYESVREAFDKKR